MWCDVSSKLTQKTYFLQTFSILSSLPRLSRTAVLVLSSLIFIFCSKFNLISQNCCLLFPMRRGAMVLCFLIFLYRFVGFQGGFCFSFFLSLFLFFFSDFWNLSTLIMFYSSLISFQTNILPHHFTSHSLAGAIFLFYVGSDFWPDQLSFEDSYIYILFWI